jgi:photosystem II stability/assembly factor-like uncharacterized protein
LSATAVHGVTAQVAIVVGSLLRNDGIPEGLILATETTGRTWRRLATEAHDLNRVTFQAVYFGDRLRGWVAGIRVDSQGLTRAVIFRTEDGGNHWREGTLLGDQELLVSSVHSLQFSTDRDGMVTVMVATPAGERAETTYATEDAGRTWNVSSFRESVALRVSDGSTSMVDDTQGFRVRPSDLPGVTRVEGTASGGRDWMPLCELSVRDLDTYYGLGR